MRGEDSRPNPTPCVGGGVATPNPIPCVGGGVATTNTMFNSDALRNQEWALHKSCARHELSACHMATTFNGHSYAFSNSRNAYEAARAHGGLEIFQNAGKAPAFALRDRSTRGYVSKAAAEFLRSHDGDVEALWSLDIADMSVDGGKPIPTLLLRSKPQNVIASFVF